MQTTDSIRLGLEITSNTKLKVGRMMPCKRRKKRGKIKRNDMRSRNTFRHREHLWRINDQRMSGLLIKLFYIYFDIDLSNKFKCPQEWNRENKLSHAKSI